MARQLTPKQRSAIERAKRTPELQPLLFRKAEGIEWLEPFEAAGFLDPLQMPAPKEGEQPGYVVVPAWPITDYLVSIAPQLGLPENLDVAERVINFLRGTTAHAKREGISNYRVWWQLSKVLCHLPVPLVQDADIAMVDHWLDDPYDRGLMSEVLGEQWLVQLFQSPTSGSKKLALSLIGLLYKATFVDEEGRQTIGSATKISLRMEPWYAQKLTNAVANLSGKVLGEPAVIFFRETLERALTVLKNDPWSSIWRPAIEEHEQNRPHEDVEHVLIDAFRNSLDGFVENSHEHSNELVAALLKSNFTTIARIGIHTFNVHFKLLPDLQSEVIQPRFFSSNFRHELWHLLKNHYAEFSEETREKTIEVIRQLRTDDSSDSASVSTAYEHAIWFSAIKDYSKSIQIEYSALINVTGGEPENPDFASYWKMGWVKDESPIASSDLETLPAPELIRKLNSFQEINQFDGPNLRGLTKALRQAVKSNPRRFTKDLQLLHELDLAFIYEIIEGLHDLWLEKASLPWNDIWRDLLSFLEHLVKRDAFWSAANGLERNSFVANRDWIVGAIGRLVESGCKSDSHAFSEEMTPRALSILTQLLNLQPGEKFELDSDAVSVAINSPRGRCLEALINLCLHSCRRAMSDKAKHEAAWQIFESIFEQELNRRTVNEYEFATLIANYLPNFLFMSKNWTTRNLARIFSYDDYLGWLCAMQGYAYVSTVYEEIYKFLRDQGHLFRALDDKHLADRVERSVIQQIAVAYLNDFEDLESKASALPRLIERNKSSELIELIRFIWTQHKNLEQTSDNLREKVFLLWQRIITTIDTSQREGQKVASHLCGFLSFVDEINDENRQLISAAIPFANQDHRAYEALRNISRLSAQQPVEAYSIWGQMIDRNPPSYPDESIEEALWNIFSLAPNGQKLATEIADRYLREGNEMPSKLIRKFLKRKDTKTSGTTQ